MNAAFLNRTFVFDVELSRRQRKALARCLASQRRVYNAALEEWISSYRWASRLAARLGLASPSKTALKTIERDALNGEKQAIYDHIAAWKAPDWYSQNSALSQRGQIASLGETVITDPSVMTRWTLMRLELARRGFFDRLKAGRTPGFPRFRAASRWSTIGWIETPGKVFAQPSDIAAGKRAYGALKLPGLPGRAAVRMHRLLPEGAEVRAATMTRRGTRWQVAFSCRIPVTHGVETDAMLGDLAESEVAGYDWGIETLATADDGGEIANPRHSARLSSRVRRAQRAVARAKRGARRRQDRVRHLAALKRREACGRRTAMRQAAAEIVGAALAKGQRVLAFEKLAISNMTRSARGTTESPGRNVRAKSGLNRSILDAAPAALLSTIQAKAESAGLRMILVDPRGTSIICSSCGSDVPKTLRVREHRCACGARLGRDLNAAVNIRWRGWQAALRAAAAALKSEAAQAA